MAREIVLELRTEKVLNSIKAGKRLDGRAFDEYRKLELKKDVFQNAHGSAWVKLGETEVLAGIKLEPGEPYPDSPDEGTIVVGAELMPLASPSFEVGPPREEAMELARVVDRSIRESNCMDFKELCIREGELVWIVFMDFYVSNDDGNLFDAAQYAVMSALLNTKVPKLEDDKIVKEEYSGKLKVESKPVLCTFAKIAENIVLDPTFIEEKAMSSRLSVAVLEDKISAFQKGLAGSFTKQQLEQCIDTAFEKSKDIRKLL